MSQENSLDPKNGIAAFLSRAAESIGSAAISHNLSDTRATRTLRKFSIKEVCEFLGVTRNNFDRLMKHDGVPQGEQRGREVLFTADDIMRIRIINSAIKDGRKRIETLHWRKTGDRLPVIVVGAQKGGVGKSLCAANCAHYAMAFHGLRVGIIDADPQATASLYFADHSVDVGSIDTQTFTNFMGMQEPGDPIVMHPPEKLNAFWKKTAWPGLRLLPGGPSIQEGDINLFFLFKKPDPSLPKFHELLKNAIDRFDRAFPPRLAPKEIVDHNGHIIEERYQEALNETFDVIIIDCAPALSLTMLNTIVAGSSLIVPTKLTGWDVSTTRAYTSSASDLIQFLATETKLEFPACSSFILPSMVSMATMTDLMVLKSFMDHDPEIICPVFYRRSEAVANAAEHFQSLYEYVPPKGKKKSTDDFLRNANAVGDAILSKCIPNLPSRGFANEFVAEMYGGAVGPWTKEKR